MGEWLLAQMDVPVGSQTGAHQYATASASQDLIRVFYLPGVTTSGSMQSIITALRTTGGIRSVYSSMDSRAIAVRAPAAQMDIAGRLIDGWQQQQQNYEKWYFCVFSSQKTFLLFLNDMVAKWPGMAAIWPALAGAMAFSLPRQACRKLRKWSAVPSSV